MSIQDAIIKANKSNSFMVAVWRIENGRIYLDRNTVNFPEQDFYSAISLLREDLERECGKGLLLSPDPLLP